MPVLRCNTARSLVKKTVAEFKKAGGKRPNSGRKPGVPNKLTSDVKGMILAALDKAGGADYLYTQSAANPAAFMTLVGKVLPTTHAGDPDAPIVHRVIYEIVGSKS